MPLSKFRNMWFMLKKKEKKRKKLPLENVAELPAKVSSHSVLVTDQVAALGESLKSLGRRLGRVMLVELVKNFKILSYRSLSDPAHIT